jgi:hypothetical protein
MELWFGKSEGDSPASAFAEAAEFFIHRFRLWALVEEIGVVNAAMKSRMSEILDAAAPKTGPVVNVRGGWYC